MKVVDIASVVSVVIDIAASSIIAPSSQGARRSNRAATYEMSAIPGSALTIRKALVGCAASGHTRNSSDIIVTSRTATSTYAPMAMLHGADRAVSASLSQTAAANDLRSSDRYHPAAWRGPWA